MDINKKAAGALGGCDTIEDVEGIFELFKISGLREKIDHIIFAMGSPMVFMVPGDGTIESEYATVLAMFLTERAEANALYQREAISYYAATKRTA